jgi:NIMA (never in mitosis gene a)-related kinase
MRTVLTGRYDPIPNIFSRDLSLFIGQMLQLKPKNRPSCDKMLKSSIIQRKLQEL